MYELRNAVGTFFKMTTIINFLSLMIVHSDHEAEEQQLFISHVWRILVQLGFTNSWTREVRIPTCHSCLT
jgi:hypothetical protein